MSSSAPVCPPCKCFSVVPYLSMLVSPTRNAHFWGGPPKPIVSSTRNLNFQKYILTPALDGPSPAGPTAPSPTAFRKKCAFRLREIVVHFAHAKTAQATCPPNISFYDGFCNFVRRTQVFTMVSATSWALPRACWLYLPRLRSPRVGLRKPPQS